MAILHAFGQRAVLKLIHSGLTRAAERRRGLRMTEFDKHQLQAICHEFDCSRTERVARAAGTTIAARPIRLSAKPRT